MTPPDDGSRPEALPGLHERLLTEALSLVLDDAGLAQDQGRWADVPAEDRPAALAAHLARTFERLIGDLSGPETRAWEEALRHLAAALTQAGTPFERLPPHLPRRRLRELRSADRVDWLVSFIKWSGILRWSRQAA